MVIFRHSAVSVKMVGMVNVTLCTFHYNFYSHVTCLRLPRPDDQPTCGLLTQGQE